VPSAVGLQTYGLVPFTATTACSEKGAAAAREAAAAATEAEAIAAVMEAAVVELDSDSRLEDKDRLGCTARNARCAAKEAQVRAERPARHCGEATRPPPTRTDRGVM
jgi:hypothetical protein